MYHGRVRDNYGNRAEHASQIAWQFSTAGIKKTHICYHWTPHGYQSFYRCTLGPKVSVIEAPSVGLHMLAWASVAIHDIRTPLSAFNHPQPRVNLIPAQWPVRCWQCWRFPPPSLSTVPALLHRSSPATMSTGCVSLAALIHTELLPAASLVSDLLSF